MLAVKAARDARPEIAVPRMVIPATAYAAFHKAGAYLRVAVDTVPVDPATLRAGPKAMAAACTDGTVLIVASAPFYAQGVIDPVEVIAALAAERGFFLQPQMAVDGLPSSLHVTLTGVSTRGVERELIIKRLISVRAVRIQLTDEHALAPRQAP